MKYLIAVILLMPTLAMARDDGQWAKQSPEIRQWFLSVMQPENPYQSCCGEADAFDVELDGDNPDGSISTIIINGKGIYPDGTHVDVPRSKLQAKFGNPLDKYILFIGSGDRIYCLIPKVGA
jgi:hypothetical protein